MPMHLGLVGPLPPVPSGPADYLAGMLPALARHARVTCFVPDVDEVAAELRAAYTVRSLEERDDTSIDLLHYHLANNEHHEAVFEAALAGPPGLAIVHDGSVHHLAVHITLTRHQPMRYWSFLRDAHGDPGGELAALRINGHGAQIEQFLYDALRGVVDRHLGALTHSRYAAELVRSRMPGLPVWVVPHYARPMASALGKDAFGVAPDTFAIGHFGFITPPKRPLLLLEAFARVVRAGYAAHLLLAGKDDTFGMLAATIARLRLDDHVTVTGYLSAERLEGLIQAVDAVVSLRSPHVAETSGTLTLALAAGKPVVVQQIGSWAELPTSIAVQVPADGDEVAALARAFTSLAADPALRERLGDEAAAYAREHFDVDRCARAAVEASEAIVAGSRLAPRDVVRARAASVRHLLASAPALPAASLTLLPPARPGARLLVLGAAGPLADALGKAWGYEVAIDPAGSDAADPDATTLALVHAAGSCEAVVWLDDRAVDLPDPRAVLDEANRVLVGGGLLLVGPAPHATTIPVDWSSPMRAYLELAGFACETGDDRGLLARKASLPVLDRLHRVVSVHGARRAAR